MWAAWGLLMPLILVNAQQTRPVAGFRLIWALALPPSAFGTSAAPVSVAESRVTFAEATLVSASAAAKKTRTTSAAVVDLRERITAPFRSARRVFVADRSLLAASRTRASTVQTTSRLLRNVAG